MSEHPSKVTIASSIPGGHVAALAKEALAVLAARSPRKRRRSRNVRVEELCDALLASDSYLRHAVVADLISEGVTTDQIFDEYVPLTASLLGEKWVDDKLSFADVTIGASRLQELARSLGGRYEPVGPTIPLGRSALMVVPSFEQHTLGAFIAAGQLRRHGLWMHLALGVEGDDLLRIAHAQNFAMIGISASSMRHVEQIRGLVERLAEDGGVDAPVVLGGALLAQDIDLCAATGVDLATTNIREVVDFCGFRRSDDRAVPKAMILD